MIEWMLVVRIGDRGADKRYGSWSEVVQALRGTVIPALPKQDHPRILAELRRGVDGTGAFTAKGDEWHITAQRMPESFERGKPLQEEDWTCLTA